MKVIARHAFKALSVGVSCGILVALAFVGLQIFGVEFDTSLALGTAVLVALIGTLFSGANQSRGSREDNR
jgi:hypothetical protein